MGELVTIRGAHWDQEMGILRFIARKGGLDCPAVLFNDVPLRERYRRNME